MNHSHRHFRQRAVESTFQVGVTVLPLGVCTCAIYVFCPGVVQGWYAFCSVPWSRATSCTASRLHQDQGASEGVMGGVHLLSWGGVSAIACAHTCHAAVCARNLCCLVDLSCQLCSALTEKQSPHPRSHPPATAVTIMGTPDKSSLLSTEAPGRPFYRHPSAH